jgi:5-methyltetrahydrofolate--homocysteine methyltransferase
MLNKRTDALICDGGFGSELFKLGLPTGKPTCVWNIERPDNVLKVHVWYLDAGARVITSNTFTSNPWILGSSDLAAQCCIEGMRIANEARAAYKNSGVITAFDIGPSGQLMEPYGELSIEDAIAGYETCAAAVLTDEKLLPNIILLETFSDLTEAKAAILGAKRAYAKAKRQLPPIFASCSYQQNGRLLSGETPETAAALLCSLGVSAVGANCGMGPDEMLPIIKKLAEVSTVPVFANPNAGLPETIDGKAVYTLSPKRYAASVKKLVAAGARMVGGCCGTNPAHIKAIAEELKEVKLPPFAQKDEIYASGSGASVRTTGKLLLIADRLLPIPQKEIIKLADAKDWDSIIDAAAQLEEFGANAINIDLKGAKNEAEAYRELIPQLQLTVRIPLSIDTDSPEALESALLHYRGRAIINACDCSPASLSAIIPIYKIYGGLLIVKTKDMELPKTPDQKLTIAKATLNKLKKQGVPSSDIVFDPMVLPVRTHMSSLYSARGFVRMLHEKANVRAALGVSNYSLGKTRRAIRETFFISSVITLPPDVLFVNMRSAHVRNMIRDLS